MTIQQPNILVIFSDQHSGLITTQAGYPHIKTPGLDKIAANGVSYMRSYCAYPVCVASRAAFMTGMMPSHSWENLEAYPCIGKTLQDADYQTAYYGKWHVGFSKMHKVEQWHGFNEYKDLLDDSKSTALSIDFLKRDHDKPFFLVTSLLNPHDCCELARRMSGLEDNYHDGGVEERMDLNFCPPIPENFQIPINEPEGISTRRDSTIDNWKTYRVHPTDKWKEADWRQYMYGYDRLVEKFDQHVLSLVNTLEERGLLENTLIIYTSDHGDGHASHNWNQKMTFYEEAINVPFMISWKGHTDAGIIDKETFVNSGVDLFPSICTAAGITPNENLHGKSLISQKGNSAYVARDYVVSEMRQTNRKSNDPEKYHGRMVVSKDIKYMIFDIGENPEQLFDIKNDPGECNPVTNNPAYTDQLKQHRAYLREWIDETNDVFPREVIPD